MTQIAAEEVQAAAARLEYAIKWAQYEHWQMSPGDQYVQSMNDLKLLASLAMQNFVGQE